MTKIVFAPPKSARAPPEPSKDDPLADWLNTPDGEVAFFRALIDRRPVGTAKHWAMIDITLALKKTAPPPAYEKLPLQQPWDKYNSVYNSDYLQEDPAKEGEADAASHTARSTGKDDSLAADGFESAEFSLEPLSRIDADFASLKHDRCLRADDATPSPAPSPTRDFPAPARAPTTAAPARATAAGKRKRNGADEDHADGPASKKVAPALAQMDASSDASELTDLDDEAEDEGDPEEEAPDEDDGTSESAGGDEYKDSPSAAQSPDVAARIRSMPSMKKASAATSRSRTAALSEGSEKKTVKKRAPRKSAR